MANKTLRVRVSGSNVHTMRIEDAATGELIPYVVDAKIAAGFGDVLGEGRITATLTVLCGVDVECDSDVRHITRDAYYATQLHHELLAHLQRPVVGEDEIDRAHRRHMAQEVADLLQRAWSEGESKRHQADQPVGLDLLAPEDRVAFIMEIANEVAAALRVPAEFLRPTEGNNTNA